MAENKSGYSGRRSLKNILIDSPMQSRLGLNLVALNFVVAGLGALILLKKVNDLKSVIEDIPSLSANGSEPLADVLVGFVTTSFGLVIVSVAVNFLAGIFFSHRFAGPTKVIIDSMDDLMKTGSIGERELRPNDELKPIMAKLKELAQHVQIKPK